MSFSGCSRADDDVIDTVLCRVGTAVLAGVVGVALISTADDDGGGVVGITVCSSDSVMFARSAI